MPDLGDTSLFDNSFPHLLAQAPLSSLYKAIQGLWPSQLSPFQADQAAVCTAFSRHVKGEISLARHDRQLFAPCTLASTTNTVCSMRMAPRDTLTEIIDRRRGESINIDEMPIQRALEMCLRISLAINVNSRSLAVGETACHERPLDWYGHESVQDLTGRAFQVNKGGHRMLDVAKVEGMSTAEYLVNSCSTEIEWINYFTDHLRLDPNGRILLIFRHKAFLKDRVDRAGVVGFLGDGHGCLPYACQYTLQHYSSCVFSQVVPSRTRAG